MYTPHKQTIIKFSIATSVAIVVSRPGRIKTRADVRSVRHKRTPPPFSLHSGTIVVSALVKIMLRFKKPALVNAPKLLMNERKIMDRF